MKSIKEKAEESLLGYDEVQAPAIGRGFVLGANYVLDIVEQCLTPQKCLTDNGVEVCDAALVKTVLQTIEQLKK